MYRWVMSPSPRQVGCCYSFVRACEDLKRADKQSNLEGRRREEFLVTKRAKLFTGKERVEMVKVERDAHWRC